MDNDVEYIVMGKGLGFQKKIGETVKNPLAWEVRNFTLGSMKLENKSFV